MEQQKSLVFRLTTKVIPPMLDDEESNGKNFPGLGYLEIGIELYPYVKVDDMPAFFDWLDKNGHGGIAKRTIHHKTFQAWAGEMIDDPLKARKLPEKLLTIGKIPTASLKAEKKSSKKRK